MGAKIGVLVFPAGEINSVELHDALSTCVNIRLVGASSIDRHGEYVFQNYISGVPKINEDGFIDAFNSIIEENDIQIVIPTHDDIALFFAKNREAIHARVLTADYHTAAICRDKQKIYETFEKEDFCPRVYDRPEIFPAFIKPREGQGSVGAIVLKDISDVPENIVWSEYVICEYLPGEELTVDCFTDKDGRLQAVLPRSRERIFGGVSVRAKVKALTEEIYKIASVINEKLHFLGLWYFQIKKDGNGRFKLLEVAVRCASSMCTSRALGINLPLLSVYAAMGYQTEIFANDYALEADRMLISRYKTDMDYQCVYIDLDDTILINNKVHLPAIWFLYQCVNSGKKIVLLTRHHADHDDTAKEALTRHKIPVELFDEIVELPFTASKYTVMNPKGAIFIDNSYAERKLVHEKLKIPVFDVDAIEVLMDWRR